MSYEWQQVEKYISLTWSSCLVFSPINVEKGMVLIGFPKVKSGKGYGKEGDKRDLHQKQKRERQSTHWNNEKKEDKHILGAVNTFVINLSTTFIKDNADRSSLITNSTRCAGVREGYS